MSGFRGSFAVTLVLLLLTGGVHGYSTGAPDDVCRSLLPGHGVTAQTSDSPYGITTSPSTVMPGKPITVTISGDTFRGFLLQARSNDIDIGTFSSLPSTLRLACSGRGVTHRTNVDKTSVTMKWTPPANSSSYDSSGVIFVATVVKYHTMLWKNVTSALLAADSPETTIETTTKTAPATTERVMTTATPIEPVDYTKALIIASKNTTRGQSRLLSVFGDPSYYCTILENRGDGSLTGIADVSRSIFLNALNFFQRLSVDYDGQLVYYANDYYHRLSSGPFVFINSTSNKANVSVGNTAPIKSVALDWVSKNLYWTQGNSIRVIQLSGPYDATIVSTYLSNVEDIAVNPLDGYLFWCDATTIQRSDLKGSERKLLYSHESLRATKLAIDYSWRRLYYLINGFLRWMNYDGTNHNQFSLGSFQGSSLAVHEDIIMLGHQSAYGFLLFRHNATSIRHTTYFALPYAEEVTDIAMFSRQNQPVVASPCTENNGGCSHLCFTTSNTTRVCGCADKHHLAADGTSCVPIDWTKALTIVSRSKDKSGIFSLFGDPTYYASIVAGRNDRSLTGLAEVSSKLVAPSGFLQRLSVDYDTQLVYYADDVYHRLSCGLFVYFNSTGNTYTFTIENNTLPIKSVAVDWVSKNLYWTQGSSIRVMRFAGEYDTTVVSESLNAVEDIAVNPLDGYLFWCDAESIQMSDLTGNGRRILYSNATLLATDIVVDYLRRKLYYLAYDTLGWMDYDGSNHRQLFGINASSLAIHEDIIMLSSATSCAINMYGRNETNLWFITSIEFAFDDELLDIAMFSRQSQPAFTSPCSMNNGGCSQLCFTTSNTTRVCGCDSRYGLDADGTSCSLTTTSSSTTTTSEITINITTTKANFTAAPATKATTEKTSQTERTTSSFPSSGCCSTIYVFLFGAVALIFQRF